MATMDFGDTIRGYAKAKGFNPTAAGKWEVNDDNTASKIYAHAASQGWSGEDLDNAFGWNAGTANGWATKNGLKALARPMSQQATNTSAAGQNLSIMDEAAKRASGTIGASSQVEKTDTGPGFQVNPQSYTGVGSARGQAAQTEWNEGMSAAGRLGTMLDKGGALMRSAALRGNQAAASRGLMGSTMGIEAAQKAMIDSASPIATADASIYGQQAMANTAQANAWDTADLNRQQSDAQFGSTLKQGYDKMAMDESQFGRTLNQNESQFARNLTEQGRQANLSASTQLTVAGMNYDVQDRRLSQEDKQFLQQNALEARKLDQQAQQFAQQMGLSWEELGMNRDKMSQQDRQFYDGLSLERSKLDQQAQQFNQEWENRFSLETMAQKNRIDLAGIDATNKKELMSIEAAYKKDIAGNENISNAWGTTMAEIGKIQNNPDLEEDAKTTLINNTLGSFKSFTGFWKKVSGGSIDVTDLLSFGVTSTKKDTGTSTTKPVGTDAPGGGGDGGGDG